MRTSKISRLPQPIREQLNLRIQDNEPAKTTLAWVNQLPEVQELLAKEFDSRPINAVNLSDWRRGTFREWQARQDAAAMLQNLQEASADKDLTDAFNQKLAQWASIHLASTAQALITREEDPERKWTRLRQLAADVTRLRRSEFHAGHLELERQRLDLVRNKNEQDLDATFWEWTKRPEIRAKLFPKQKQGISRKALNLIDNYLLHGISPLDPDEVTDPNDVGRYATQPPLGYKQPQPGTPDSNGTPGTPVSSDEDDPDKDDPPATPAHDSKPDTSDEAIAKSPPGHNGKEATPIAEKQFEPGKSNAAQPPGDIRCEASPPREPSATAHESPITGAEETSPHPFEQCPQCHAYLPPLLPTGERPSSWCKRCGSALRPPGSLVEHCPKCKNPLPELRPDGQRSTPNCPLCNAKLPPPPSQIETHSESKSESNVKPN